MRLIDSEDLGLAIVRKAKTCNTLSASEILRTIDEMETVDPKTGSKSKLVKGVWVVTDKCQECGECGAGVAFKGEVGDVRENLRLWNYCPVCGSRMGTIEVRL